MKLPPGGGRHGLLVPGLPYLIKGALRWPSHCRLVLAPYSATCDVMPAGHGATTNATGTDPSAQRRWRDLEYEEFDVLFRFRLGNLKRAWGIVVQSHFFMVWWDRTHSIYPTSD